jgi:hypothetical protein
MRLRPFWRRSAAKRTGFREETHIREGLAGGFGFQAETFWYHGVREYWRWLNPSRLRLRQLMKATSSSSLFALCVMGDKDWRELPRR